MLSISQALVISQFFSCLLSGDATAGPATEDGESTGEVRGEEVIVVVVVGEVDSFTAAATVDFCRISFEL